MKKTTEQLLTEAVHGSRESLEEIIRCIQGKISGLALRMLLHPADTEDATQEILIKKQWQVIRSYRDMTKRMK
jgi:DNA-directed RNA polymerase specialized sigma24 family protein